MTSPATLRTVRARLFRYLFFESRLPYRVVRGLAPLLIGAGTGERAVHDFRMRLSLRDILQTRLMLDGMWEPSFTRWWAYLTARSDVVFDIGAHCGYYTLFARSVNPAVSIHAFEPNPALRENMLDNVWLNGFRERIWVNAEAVGATDDRLRLHVRDIEPATASIHALPVYDRTETVACVSLDSYRRRNDIDVVDLVKFDIEGGESAAFRGMVDGLRELRYRQLMIEVHKKIMPDGYAEDLRGMLLGFGYVLYRIHETTAEPLGDTEPILDYDLWLAFSPLAKAEFDQVGAGKRLELPEKYARIYRGHRWVPG